VAVAGAMAGAMACRMDEPTSCCCETEVRAPGSPRVQDFVAPVNVELSELVSSVAPVAEVAASFYNVRFKTYPTQPIYPVLPQIYLTHQSLLI
jgi:hypothetical protein